MDLAADAKDFEAKYFGEMLCKKGKIEIEESCIEGCKNISIKEVVYDEFN